LGVNFALLDPDLDSESGSTGPIESGSNPDLDPKSWILGLTRSGWMPKNAEKLGKRGPKRIRNTAQNQADNWLNFLSRELIRRIDFTHFQIDLHKYIFSWDRTQLTEGDSAPRRELSLRL
jgi:hypothetical protein